jgi:glycosyltransferase involved in cell wall biosynthesis
VHKNRLHLLYFTAENWPTHRSDIVTLFGKYLPRLGITCDLVTGRVPDSGNNLEEFWGGGEAILCQLPQNRACQYFVTFLHNLFVLITMDPKKYDAIQVRDMTVTALAGLVFARLKGVKFFYWLSFPQSEGQISRARRRGIKAGIRFWFPLMQGIFGKWLLYSIILPRSDHVFVQSHMMQLDIARKGIPISKMTPIPMGVDADILMPERFLQIDEPRLAGKRVIVYLGTLDPARNIDFLLKMLLYIKDAVPNILLVMVGDSDDLTHREWLKQEAVKLGLVEEIIWTGWLQSSIAWRYVSAAEIGLSPIPRGHLFDMGSPTKVLEYMAMGLPVVVNDNPDQAQVIAESGAGLCVSLEPHIFAESVIQLLKNKGLCHKMGVYGQRYVAHKRAYDVLARNVADKYHELYCQRLN